jgi:hypothetical protein
MAGRPAAGVADRRTNRPYHAFVRRSARRRRRLATPVESDTLRLSALRSLNAVTPFRCPAPATHAIAPTEHIGQPNNISYDLSF